MGHRVNYVKGVSGEGTCKGAARRGRAMGKRDTMCEGSAVRDVQWVSRRGRARDKRC